MREIKFIFNFDNGVIGIVRALSKGSAMQIAEGMAYRMNTKVKQ